MTKYKAATISVGGNTSSIWEYLDYFFDLIWPDIQLLTQYECNKKNNLLHSFRLCIPVYPVIAIGNENPAQICTVVFCLIGFGRQASGNAAVVPLSSAAQQLKCQRNNGGRDRANFVEVITISFVFVSGEDVVKKYMHVNFWSPPETDIGD